MKEQWRKLAARIDALSLRERVMVFVSAVVVAVFMMNALFIDSPTTRNKALSARMAQQQTELQALQGQIQALMQKRADPNAANLARRDGIKRQIAEIDATLKDMQHSLVPAQNMKAVLQEMLARNPRLQLIALRTLPAAPLVAKRDKAGKPTPPHPLPSRRIKPRRARAAFSSMGSRSRFRAAMPICTITWRASKSCRGACSGRARA